MPEQAIEDPFVIEEVSVRDATAADETLRCSIFCKDSEKQVANELFEDVRS